MSKLLTESHNQEQIVFLLTVLVSSVLNIDSRDYGLVMDRTSQWWERIESLPHSGQEVKGDKQSREIYAFEDMPQGPA